MKIERNIITIQVSVDEFNEIKREYNMLKYDNEKLDYKKHKMLSDFFDSICMSHNNASYKVDRECGTY